MNGEKLLKMKRILNKIIVLIKNFDIVISKILNFIGLNDEKYIKLMYQIKMKRKLNLDNPNTFNEKLQWLKLYDRKKIYNTMVDKYEAKKYVANIIGEDYIIPTYGIYDKFDEIDFDKLPNQFVIKCTHDSGGIVICRDKNKLDIEKTKKTINKSLKRNYFYSGREWPYKNIEPRIIIEKYMHDNEIEQLKDYKFYCFNGQPKYLYVSEGLENHETAKIEFFDMNFKPAPFGRTDYQRFKNKPEKPINFEKMKDFSKDAVLLVLASEHYDEADYVRDYKIFNEDAEVYVQEKDMTEVEKNDLISHFKTTSNHSIIGLAIIGGAFGEGIDLVGDSLIGVAIVGIGLPKINFESNQIVEYYQQNEIDGFNYAYTYPGMNKVMQAVGRLIRTENDRGAALLIDERYMWNDYKTLFKKEWNDYEVVYSTDELNDSLQKFFKS